MSATPSSITRSLDSAGDEISTFTKNDGSEVQAVALDPEVMGEILTTAATNGTPIDQDEAKASGGRVFRAEVILDDPPPGGSLWLLIVDKATAAVNTNVPFLRSPKISGDFASIDLGVYGVEFLVGCQLVVSSTPDVVTLPGGAAGFFQWAVI